MKPDSEKPSSIERLKQQLHSRKGAEKNVLRRRFDAQSTDVPTSWKPTQSKKRRANYSPLIITLAVSFVFFVIALAFSGFVFLQDSNTVSAENV